MNKKISHVEIYYEDGSMDRVNNEEAVAKNFTKKQLEWIEFECLNTLGSNKTCYAEIKDNVTMKNYKDFKERDFSDILHDEYQTVISLLDILKKSN